MAGKKSDQDLEINPNAPFPVKHTFALAVLSVDMKIRCGALWSHKGSVLLFDIETTQDPHRSNIACLKKAMCRWPLPPFILESRAEPRNACYQNYLQFAQVHYFIRVQRVIKAETPPGAVVTWKQSFDFIRVAQRLLFDEVTWYIFLYRCWEEKYLFSVSPSPTHERNSHVHTPHHT